MNYWALWVAVLLVLFSSVVNIRDSKMIVPNWLSYSSLAAGLLAALLVGPGNVQSAGGGPVSSLAAALVGLVSLFPLYAIRCLGAGSVKMHMAFGAWVGCALPIGMATLLVGVAGLFFFVIIIVLAFSAGQDDKKKPADEKGSQPHRSMPVQPVLAFASILCLSIMSLVGML